MLTQILIIIIVTLILLFVKYLFYAIKGKQCVNIDVFLKDGVNDKFNEIMDSIYNESGEEVEELRKDAMLVSILTHMLVICGISFPTIGLIVYADTLGWKFKIIIIVVSIILLLLALYSYTYQVRYFKKYNESYKKKILNNYIRKMNKGFAYDMNSTISREIYEGLGLCDEVIEYYGQDHLTGVVDGRRNLNASKLYVKYMDNLKQMVFCGIFAYANTDISDTIKIVETSKKIPGTPNVTQNVEEFNKYYLVYSENGGYKLSEEIMNYMIDFRRKYDVDVEVIIKKNKTYVKVHTGDIFEPRVYKYWQNKDRLWSFFLVVKYIVDLTDMLK